jgi:hypothetical protein
MSGHSAPLWHHDDPRVRRQLKAFKARGWMTLDELNGLLRTGDISSDEMDDAIATLADLGIAVVDPEEAAEELGVSVDTVLDLARALGVRPGEVAFLDCEVGELVAEIADAVLDTIERNRAIVKAQIAAGIEEALAGRLTPEARRAIAAVSARP